MQLTKLKEDILNDVKQELLKTGQVMPVGMVFQGKECDMVPIVFYNPEEKQDAYYNFGKEAVIRRSIPELIVCACKAAGRHYKDDKEKEYIEQNYETESPFTYPEDMRLDLILLFGIRFKRDVSKSSIFSLMQYYTKKDNEIVFGEKNEFTSLFDDVKDWNQHHLIRCILAGIGEGIKKKRNLVS